MARGAAGAGVLVAAIGATVAPASADSPPLVDIHANVGPVTAALRCPNTQAIGPCAGVIAPNPRPSDHGVLDIAVTPTGGPTLRRTLTLPGFKGK